ncbi:MAG: hypothetical protein ACKVON_14330 [Beijerinckiaceae bacterium]
MSYAVNIVAHHLRLFGVQARSGVSPGEIVLENSNARIILHHHAAEAESIQARLTDAFSCLAVNAAEQAWRHLRSFHIADILTGPDINPVVVDENNAPIWAWKPDQRGGTLVIATDLAADLVLMRQGDPAASANRPTEAQWGIAGERPTYLFEGQLEADKPHDRMADWWMWTLRDALIRHAGIKPDDILPFGAKGMVIVTGDDDQAPFEDYRAQEKLLGGLPVTYFLHPLTKHTRQSMAEHSMGRSVEWEIHPDALETPHEYDARFDEQAAWFEGLTGRPPRLVRNHGFLNDGYWGHTKAWQKHGITGSSNLPGLNGRVLNGSLLPARLALNGQLTDHWSMLTVFGDGVMFVLEWDDETAARAIFEAGQRIIESGIPGILVFNLHPANHVIAASMHKAVKRLISEQGFATMTFGAALEWFSRQDRKQITVPVSNVAKTDYALSDCDLVSTEALTKSQMMWSVPLRAIRFVQRFWMRSG